MFEFKTKGTCSLKVNFEIEDGKVHNINFEDGCDGNLKALSILAEGMGVEELVTKLKGIRCDNRSTSCADQLALAVEKYST
jgi:uncharacterized protein (TIGR03905 family)